MALKRYLALMFAGTIASWLAWVLVLFTIDPFVSGSVGLAGFSFTLFLALLGTFSLLGFLFRRTFSRTTIAFRQIGVSLRQGMLFSLIVVGVLLLRGTGLYTWWIVVFFVAGVTVLEFFFLTREAGSR